MRLTHLLYFLFLFSVFCSPPILLSIMSTIVFQLGLVIFSLIVVLHDVDIE